MISIYLLPDFYTFKYPTFISLAIGDFNCYIGQRGVGKKTDTFEDYIKEFESHGMKSAYHTRKNEEFGKEQR